jgi:hypothetical protein
MAVHLAGIVRAYKTRTPVTIRFEAGIPGLSAKTLFPLSNWGEGIFTLD